MPAISAYQNTKLRFTMVKETGKLFECKLHSKTFISFAWSSNTDDADVKWDPSFGFANY